MIKQVKGALVRLRWVGTCGAKERSTGVCESVFGEGKGLSQVAFLQGGAEHLYLYNILITPAPAHEELQFKSWPSVADLSDLRQGPRL